MLVIPATAVTVASFHNIFIRTDVDYMSKHLLGVEYSVIKRLIYPSPSYKSFIINKKNGSPRVIQEPRKPLKDLQVKILAFLETNANPEKPCVHGFTQGRSIVTNAQKHCSPKTRFLLNIDLKNFFPSITFYRVRGLLQKPPFSCSYSVATVLAHICTKTGELPQGAPTSPFISNLICRRLDSDLMELARRHQSTYTRYADDISFSFSVRESSRLPLNICSYDSGVVRLGNELISTVVNHGFNINEAKTRLSNYLRRLEVTGLTINEFPNVKRNFIDRIRGALHAWERYGYDAAQANWESHVQANNDGEYNRKRWTRQRRFKDTPKLERIIWGKLLYLRMVRGSEDTIYSRLASKYNILVARDHGGGLLLPVKKIVTSERDAELATFVISWEGVYRPNNQPEEFCAAEGTAFAFCSARQLITCEHLFRFQTDSGHQVDFNSVHMQEKEIKVHNPFLNTTYTAQLIKLDLDRDVAVLEIIGDTPNIPHFVPKETIMKRNEPGILIGYPNWHPGKPLDQASTQVANLYMRGALNRIEIRELIRKGNSGGPFVDELYRVAGIAQSGATQTQGNNECLTIKELEKWLLLHIN
jgi:RNA-directed DNA polymerase